MENIWIGNRRLGAGAPTFVIAEAGVNHNGQIELAHELIAKAAQSGADAVKFQTFSAERLASAHAPKAGYQLRFTDPDESQRAMLKRLELPLLAYDSLKRHAEMLGLVFLSSAFDLEAFHFLERLSVAAHKIPSGELTNAPLLEAVARSGKPTILSTGMSTIEELDEAAVPFRSAKAPLILLQCTSSYPTPLSDANVAAMATMATRYQTAVGFSDHCLESEASLSAVALGATVIEKHFTLDRNSAGPDHQASLNPVQMTEFISSIRRVERALGSQQKRVADCEVSTREIARKSLALVSDKAAGDAIAESDLTLLRPGNGIGWKDRHRVVGGILRRALSSGELLRWDDLA